MCLETAKQQLRSYNPRKKVALTLHWNVDANDMNLSDHANWQERFKIKVEYLNAKKAPVLNRMIADYRGKILNPLASSALAVVSAPAGEWLKFLDVLPEMDKSVDIVPETLVFRSMEAAE